MAPLQLVASCITDHQFVLSAKAYTLGGPHSIGLGLEDFAPLKAGPRTYRFSAQISFEVIENDLRSSAADRYRVRTLEYRYHLLTEDYTEILLWHWHPEGRSDVRSPHLHVGHTILKDSGLTDVMQHVPTGRTAFEEVVHHLVEQCRVDTKRSRDEAIEITLASLQQFHEYRRWHVAPPARAAKPI